MPTAELTFRWVTSRGQLKVSLPVPQEGHTKVIASDAALTRSQVRDYLPVPDAASSEAELLLKLILLKLQMKLLLKLTVKLSMHLFLT